MKYLYISLSLLFLACNSESSDSNNSGSEESGVEISSQGSNHSKAEGMVWDFEVRNLVARDPDCEEGKLCTEFSMEAPVFSGPNSERANIYVGKLMAFLMGLPTDDLAYLADKDQLLKDYINTWQKQSTADPSLRTWHNKITLASVESGNGVTSLKFFIESGLGANEPLKYYHVLNLNNKTGEELLLINHIVDVPSFIMLSENEFRRQFKMENNQPYYAIGFEFDNGVFTLPYNYCFTAEGLEYIYNPDEIALTAKESRSFKVTYKELENLLDLEVDQMDLFYQRQAELEAEQN